MSLSRSRRVATGVAAGVVVLCSALIGASLRSDDASVSVASETLSATAIPILVDPVDEVEDDTTAIEVAEDAEGAVPAADDSEEPDPDSTTDADDSEEPDPDGTTDADDSEEPDPDSTTDSGEDTNPSEDADAEGDDGTPESVTVIEEDDIEAAQAESDAATGSSDETAAPADADAAPAEPTAEGQVSGDTTTPQPAAPPIDNSLGTGGGVSNAECGLDRLVIYAGARVSGVAGQMRAALTNAGFGAGCAAPVTILASNCPLQFSGVLPAGTNYNPSQSFVASSDAVDRDTMTAVMGSIGYSGSTIDILDFGFVQPDRPGEQWIAVFIPPSLSGWEQLAGRAGISATTQSLCSASGRLGG